jgi:D-alanine-D-alanine ligase
MTDGKRKLLVLCGGRSAEHEISLLSARNVIAAVDRSTYDVLVVGIGRDGRWRLLPADGFVRDADAASSVALSGDGPEVVPAPGARLLDASTSACLAVVDTVFPVLHGTCGEDGTLQGLLKLADVPFVGCGVLASAVCMDKDVAKRLLQQAGIDVARFVVLRDPGEAEAAFEAASRELGLPLFVKPCNLGSSVGVGRAGDRRAFVAAVRDAFRFDRKVLVEEQVPGREIECAVLGNERPEASPPGEIVPRHEFYSYRAKYLDDDGAALCVPADLPPETARRVQALSVQAFRALECEGLARVDFFLTKTGRLVVNELNTMPGFTRISMYPRLWEAAGLSYTALADRLIALARERFEREAALATCAD